MLSARLLLLLTHLCRLETSVFLRSKEKESKLCCFAAVDLSGGGGEVEPT